MPHQYLQPVQKPSRFWEESLLLVTWDRENANGAKMQNRQLKTSLLVGTTICTLLLQHSVAFSADALSSVQWSGAYVGLDAGYIAGKSHFVFTEEEGSGASPGNFADPKASAFIGGVYAGYNLQAPNNVVLGIDGSMSYTNADDLPGLKEGGAPLEGDEKVGERLQWTGSARFRAGYAFGRFLPYIAGGFALARADISYEDSRRRSSLGTRTLEGWTLGAGVDYSFSDHLVGRAEYRHSDYGTDNFKMEGFLPYDLSLKTDEVRLGLAYRF